MNLNTSSSGRFNEQRGLFPYELESLVKRWEYMPGWTAWLEDRDRGQGSVGLTLIISVTSPDTDSSPDPVTGEWRKITVWHFFIVPAASYNENAWRRWFFDCVLQVHTHEAGEFFKIDGRRPFAPYHGPGRNPYVIHERGLDTEREANMDQTGTEDAREA